MPPSQQPSTVSDTRWPDAAAPRESSTLTASLARGGAIASLLQAIAYVTASLAAFQIPLDRVTSDLSGLSAYYQRSPVPLTVLSLSLVGLAVLGIGAVVPVTGELIGVARRGWALFGRNVALLCLTVVCAYYAWYLWALPRLAADGAAATNPQAPTNWVVWFMFGGMGLWVAVVGVVGVFVERTLPKGFVAPCLVKTVGFWLVVAGVSVDNLSLAILGVLIGALVGGTAYHLWLAALLWLKAAVLS
jgi:hypothetical protein